MMFRKAAQGKTRKELAFLIETTTHAVGTALRRDKDLPSLMGSNKAKRKTIFQLRYEKDSKSQLGNENHDVIPFFKNFRIFSSKCLPGERIKV